MNQLKVTMVNGTSVKGNKITFSTPLEGRFAGKLTAAIKTANNGVMVVNAGKIELVEQDNAIDTIASQLVEAKIALKKMCDWHEKSATWDKGDNGYYAAKNILNK